MNKLTTAFCLVTSLFLFANCGDNKKGSGDANTITDKDNLVTAAEKMQQNAEKMNEEMDESQKVQEERRKRGDTLAMNYKALQKYLPENIEGYQKDGDPGGESVNMGPMSLSTAKQRFKKENDYIEVTITDYNQNYATYQGLLSMGMYSVDSDEQKISKFNTGIDRTAGIEDYKKKTKDASVLVGAGFRFWIEVKGNNQPDAEMLKKVILSMKLKELAAL